MRKIEVKEINKRIWEKVTIIGLTFTVKRFRSQKYNKRLREIDWGKIFEGMNAEECTYIFIEIIKIICLDLIPIRNKINKSKIPRERKNC